MFQKRIILILSEDLNTDPATLKSIGIKQAKGKPKH